MSVIYNLDELDDDTKKELCKELTLIPVDPYVEKMKKWNPQNTRNVTPKVPILMFRVDIDKRTVKFPFYTIMQKTGIKPNRDREFPKIKENGLPKFHMQLRDYQIEVVNEAYEYLKKHATVILGMPTASGKTIMGSYLIGKCNGPTLVFVHRIQIGKAWVKTFQDCFPQYKNSIWLVGEKDFDYSEGVLVPKKCKNTKQDKNGNIIKCGKCDGCLKEDQYCPIFTICMYGRIQNVPKYIRRSIVTQVVDEAHLFCTEDKVEPLLELQPKFIIIETATLERPDGMHSMMHKLVGEHGVFRLPDKPYRVYLLKTDIKIDTIQGKRGTDFGDFTKKLVEHEERNMMVLEIIKKNPHKKPMILVRQKAHVIILKKLLEDNNINVATLFGTQQSYQDTDVLIGTIPKMGTGFDEKNAAIKFKGRESDLLILMTSIAEQKLFTQILGRVMRSIDPVLLYLVDDMALVKRHVKNVKPWILETQGITIDMKYKTDDLFIPDCIFDKEKDEFVIVQLRHPVKKTKLKLTVTNN